MYNLILDDDTINSFTTKKRNSKVKEELLQAIEEIRKAKKNKAVIELEKPTYYNVINRHLKKLTKNFHCKYKDHKITHILVEL